MTDQRALTSHHIRGDGFESHRFIDEDVVIDGPLKEGTRILNVRGTIRIDGDMEGGIVESVNGSVIVNGHLSGGKINSVNSNVTISGNLAAGGMLDMVNGTLAVKQNLFGTVLGVYTPIEVGQNVCPQASVTTLDKVLIQGQDGAGLHDALRGISAIRAAEIRSRLNPDLANADVQAACQLALREPGKKPAISR